MKTSQLVRLKTNIEWEDSLIALVIKTNINQKICDILFCQEIITCDWEDLEVICGAGRFGKT